MAYKDLYEEELIEMYQRRNILVHNGGVVNSIYLSKVAGVFKKEVNVNDKIKVDSAYLANAITKLELVFTLIACELWRKFDEDEERSSILMDFGYKYLKKGDWATSECINNFMNNDKKITIAYRTIGQLNVWLCKKEGGKYNDIQKEIDSADFSDKSLVYQIAFAALKGDNDFVFQHLPQVLKTEDLLPESLFEFPVLREIRETERFKAFIQNNEIVVAYLASINKGVENSNI